MPRALCCAPFLFLECFALFLIVFWATENSQQRLMKKKWAEGLRLHTEYIEKFWASSISMYAHVPTCPHARSYSATAR